MRLLRFIVREMLVHRWALVAAAGILILAGILGPMFIKARKIAAERREVAARNASEIFRQRWADGELVLLLQLSGDESDMRRMKSAVKLSAAQTAQMGEWIGEALRKYKIAYGKAEEILQAGGACSVEGGDPVTKALEYDRQQKAIEKDLRRKILGCLSVRQREAFFVWLEGRWVRYALANLEGP